MLPLIGPRNQYNAFHNPISLLIFCYDPTVSFQLCTRSIEPSFGLLFGDLLKEMGVETTGAAIIMSTLDALINFSGLFVGPLIRAFSYRKVSLIGSALCGLGLILTYPASTMAHLLCTYSIINGK